ncbi:MAG: hypothetical protein KME50_01210 [Nostoc desertorum CM1-VF14]|nr:hypothetical protein [Nostoc desertorum CM1-VF14]
MHRLLKKNSDRPAHIPKLNLYQAIAFTNYDHLTNYPTARNSIRRSHLRRRR